MDARQKIQANAAPVGAAESPSRSRTRTGQAADGNRADMSVVVPCSTTASLSAQRDRVWEHRLLWCLVVAILGLWAYHYVKGRVDSQLRDEILKRLVNHFPGHLVKLDHAHLEQGHAILLEGLELALPTIEGPRDVLRAQRIVASGKLEIIDLLRGNLDIRRVRIEGLELSIWPIANEHWSVQTLCSTSAWPAFIPPVDIRSGMIRIGKSSRAGDGDIICHDLRAQIQDLRSSHPLMRPIETSTSIASDPGKSHSLDPTRIPSSGELRVSASVSGGYFNRISATAHIRDDKQSWSVQGEVNKFDFSPQLVQQLPKEIATQVSQLDGLQCLSDARFLVNSLPGIPLNYELQGTIRQGRLKHSKLPFQLEDLRGDFYCKNQVLRLRNAMARSGASLFWLDTDLNGLGPSSPLVMNLRAENLNLDNRLFDSIPPLIQEPLRRFSLSGIVDAHATLAYDGERWTPNVTVRARNCSLQADVFPYPLKNITGEISYQDGIITAKSMTAFANGQSLRGSLVLTKAQPRWLMDLYVENDPTIPEGTVPIDEPLFAALTPLNTPKTSFERFIRSLQPSGKIHLDSCRFTRSAERPNLLSKSIELAIYDGNIIYSGFRYPISNIQGHVSVHDDVVMLQDMQGRNDSGRISCKFGQCVFDGSKLSNMQLNFDARSLPLAEELQLALPAPVRELWDHLQPSGIVDHVTVNLNQPASDQPINLLVEIIHDATSHSQGGKSVSLRPAFLPSGLNDIRCHLRYSPGQLQIVEMSGTPGSSFSRTEGIKAEGNCRLLVDGTWDGTLKWHPETRLMVDQGLLASLPAKMGEPLLNLGFRGPVSLTGMTQFVTSTDDSMPHLRSWDVALEIEDGGLYGGSVISGMRGTITVQGEVGEEGPLARGQLKLDALKLHGVHATGIEGPFAFERGKLMLGRDAAKATLQQLKNPMVVNPEAKGYASKVEPATATRPAVEPRALRGLNLMNTPVSQLLPPLQSAEIARVPLNAQDIRARTLSGNLFMYGSGQLDTGKVALVLHLDDADLHNMLLDLGESVPKAHGRVWADVQLSGSPVNVNTLSGNGRIELRDADLYQLPVMAKLFRILSVRPPDDGAFETADIEFRIDGDRIPLTQVALDGDVISLRGEGWTNFRRELHLELKAFVGRRGQLAAIFGPLISKNDNAAMLRIEVDGTADNPQMKRSLIYP